MKSAAKNLDTATYPLYSRLRQAAGKSTRKRRKEIDFSKLGVSYQTQAIICAMFRCAAYRQTYTAV